MDDRFLSLLNIAKAGVCKGRSETTNGLGETCPLKGGNRVAATLWPQLLLLSVIAAYQATYDLDSGIR